MQLPPERSNGKIELTGRMNQLLPTVRELQIGVNGLTERLQHGVGSIPFKVTELGEDAGIYFADAYIPPFPTSGEGDLAIEDLGQYLQPAMLWNVAEINGSQRLAVDDVVIGSVVGTDRATGLPLAVCNALPSTGIIPINLTQTGGSAGTNMSAVCSFTYTVNDVNGNELQTGFSPTAAQSIFRSMRLALTAATTGFAYRDSSGTLVITYINERPAGEQDCQ